MSQEKNQANQLIKPAPIEQNIRVVKIDPIAQSISEHYVKPSQLLDRTYELIGGECSLVETMMHIGAGHSLMGDEEGLFKDDLGGFRLSGHFVYGCAVIWGPETETTTADCRIDLDRLTKAVQFLDPSVVEVIRQNRLNGPMLEFIPIKSK